MPNKFLNLTLTHDRKKVTSRFQCTLQSFSKSCYGHSNPGLVWVLGSPWAASSFRTTLQPRLFPAPNKYTWPSTWLAIHYDHPDTLNTFHLHHCTVPSPVVLMFLLQMEIKTEKYHIVWDISEEVLRWKKTLTIWRRKTGSFQFFARQKQRQEPMPSSEIVGICQNKSH